jgi:tyrosyl-tRNA synthetase
MEINTDNKKIEEILTRNVDQVLPNKKSLKDLMQKKKIRLYFGIDPTGKKLHLGHTIALKKLQQFADLGHEAILLVGTGTVLAGDPSQREKARPRISLAEIKENILSWEKQANKILDFSKVKIKHNGDWLLKLELKEIINIASHLSAIKLFQRDMFQKRMEKGEVVWLHEMLYPMLQGYDSVFMDIDLEIGGTDQIFNMLIGRDLQQKMNNREKFILTCSMILGTDGKQMSKSSGNCIWLEDSANEMFGKTMSISDDLIISYFESITNLPLKLIKQYQEELKKDKINPRDLKKKLAQEIVKIYHSEEAAKQASQEFERVFQQKKTPSEITEIKIEEKSLNILDLLLRINLVKSKAEAKRLVSQKAVKINQQIQEDWQKKVEIKKNLVIQVGKRKFVKVVK